MRLALLWWKDWKWHKRQWPTLLRLFLLPLFVSTVYSYLNRGDYTPYHVKDVLVSHQQPVINFKQGFVPLFNVKVFLPKNTSQGEIKEFSKFCRNLCRGYTIDLYEDLKEIDRTVKHTATVIIDRFDVRTPALNYRYIDFRWRMQQHLHPDWGLWSRNQKSVFQPDGEDTALMTQRLLDSHFYRRRECQLHNCTRTRAQKPLDLMAATVSHVAQPFLNPATASSYIVLGQLCTFFSLLVAWQMADQAQEERLTGTNQLLLALGVNRLESLAAYWIVAYFKLLLMQLLIWIPPICFLKRAYDLSIVIPGLLLYSGVLASFACFCSSLFCTLFHNRLTTRLCTLIHLVFLHLGQLAQEDRNGSQSKYFIMSSLVSFPNAWYYYLRAAATRAQIGGDFVPEGNVNSLYVLPIFFVAMIVLFALALYYDTMFPGDERRRPAKTWTYPLNLSYWRKRSGPALLEKPTFMTEVCLPDEPSVEKEPSSSGTNMEPVPKKPKTHKATAIELEGVCKMIDEMWIVNRVTMKALVNEVTVLYGPRGAGGKELLELCALRLQPDYGQIIRHTTGPVAFSTVPCLLPQLKVKEMIRWQSRMRGGREGDEELTYWLNELALHDVEDKKVRELTSLQQQRLNLLLAFVGKSQLILLDEPTTNCAPGVRNLMHTFIMQHRENRAIVISTYSPEEADIADKVVFLSHGHLVSSGPLARIRQKYVQSLNLVIWPGAGFTKEKRRLIEKILCARIKTKGLTVTWEALPNENICFHVPESEEFPLQKIMRVLELKRKGLCIKHFEIQRQNVHDAYYNCIHQHDYDEISGLDPSILVRPLDHYYTALPRKTKKPCWSELKTVFSIYGAFLRRHWMSNVLSFFLPAALVICLSGWILTYTFVHTVPVNTAMFSQSGARILTNIPLMAKDTAVDYVDSLDRELLAGGRLYEEPPIVGGLQRDRRYFHVYTMKLARFSVLMMQNLLINTAMTSTRLAKETVVRMSLESLESPDWTHSNPNEWDSLLAPLTSRDLAEILIRQWTMIMILGAVVGIMLSRSALLVAQLAKDKCIGMHCLLGCRAPFYWLALILFDVTLYLLVAGVSLILLFTVAGTSVLGLVVSILIGTFGFISYLPVIYWLALKTTDLFTAHLAAMLLAGSFSIIPACFPFYIRQYGSDLEDWTNLLTFVGFFSPPLAVSLSAAIFDDLIRFGSRSTGQALWTISPFIISFLLHSITWLLLFGWFSTGSLQRKFKHWWQRLSVKPSDLIQTGDHTTQLSQRRPRSNEAVKMEESVQEKKGSRPQVSTIELTRFESVGTSMKRTEPSGASVSLMKKSMKTMSTEASKISAVPSRMKMLRRSGEDATTVEGFWISRNNLGSSVPVISYSMVELDHYADKSCIQAYIYDQQSVLIYGDVPTSRSSLLDMAAGQSYPKTGSVFVHGKKASGKTGIGYVPTDNRLCSFLSVEETLKMAARLRGYVMHVQEFINFLLQLTELVFVAKKPVWQLTYADQRMLMFACAVIDRPSILIMNEIEAYLCPTRLRTVWAVSSLLRESYKTPLLFTTSRVTEAEACSSYVIMISQGSVSLAETSCEAKKRNATMLTLTFQLKPYMEKEALNSVIISQIPQAKAYPHPHPRKLAFLINFQTKKYAESADKVRNLMDTIGVTDYQVEMPNLETIYQYSLPFAEQV